MYLYAFPYVFPSPHVHHRVEHVSGSKRSLRQSPQVHTQAKAPLLFVTHWSTDERLVQAHLRDKFTL